MPDSQQNAPQQNAPEQDAPQLKALTLWQPWATLLVSGEKRYETRSWRTGYRGPLVIHAAKTDQMVHLRREEPFRSALERAGYAQRKIELDNGLVGLEADALPRGAFVGIVKLTAMHPTGRVRPHLDDQEVAFGDFTPGRYAWECRSAQAFDEPIKARGHQGLWEVPDRLIETVSEQITDLFIV